MIIMRILLALLLAVAWSAEPVLTCTNAWARATAPSAVNGAVFLTLTNPGGTDLRLTAAHSSVCAKAELHGHRTTDTGVQMYELDALTVPAKGSVELKPGGLHVMLLGLTAPLKEGTTIAVTLTVADAAKPLQVTAIVQGIAAMGPDGGCGCPK